jgi:hypothetical protein
MGVPEKFVDLLMVNPYWFVPFTKLTWQRGFLSVFFLPDSSDYQLSIWRLFFSAYLGENEGAACKRDITRSGCLYTCEKALYAG